jgi:hypothetical protein
MCLYCLIDILGEGKIFIVTGDIKCINMKIIKLPKSYVISAFNGPTETMTLEAVSAIMSPIDTNKNKILDAAISIEMKINALINHHFFGHSKELFEKSEEFTNQVLDSDWCTFSSKRKLLTHIINSKNYLESHEKNNYENLLKKTMSYRNAFAHGKLSTNGKEVRLNYFEGITKTITLTDEYFIQIENDIITCWNLTQKLLLKSGTVSSEANL